MRHNCSIKHEVGHLNTASQNHFKVDSSETQRSKQSEFSFHPIQERGWKMTLKIFIKNQVCIIEICQINYVEHEKLVSPACDLD